MLMVRGADVWLDAWPAAILRDRNVGVAVARASRSTRHLDWLGYRRQAMPPLALGPLGEFARIARGGEPILRATGYQLTFRRVDRTSLSVDEALAFVCALRAVACEATASSLERDLDPLRGVSETQAALLARAWVRDGAERLTLSIQYADCSPSAIQRDLIALASGVADELERAGARISRGVDHAESADATLQVGAVFQPNDVGRFATLSARRDHEGSAEVPIGLAAAGLVRVAGLDYLASIEAGRAVARDETRSWDRLDEATPFPPVLIFSPARPESIPAWSIGDLTLAMLASLRELAESIGEPFSTLAQRVALVQSATLSPYAVAFLVDTRDVPAWRALSAARVETLLEGLAERLKRSLTRIRRSALATLQPTDVAPALTDVHVVADYHLVASDLYFAPDRVVRTLVDFVARAGAPEWDAGDPGSAARWPAIDLAILAPCSSEHADLRRAIRAALIDPAQAHLGPLADWYFRHATISLDGNHVLVRFGRPVGATAAPGVVERYARAVARSLDGVEVAVDAPARRFRLRAYDATTATDPDAERDDILDLAGRSDALAVVRITTARAAGARPGSAATDRPVSLLSDVAPFVVRGDARPSDLQRFGPPPATPRWAILLAHRPALGATIEPSALTPRDLGDLGARRAPNPAGRAQVRAALRVMAVRYRDPGQRALIEQARRDLGEDPCFDLLKLVATILRSYRPDLALDAARLLVDTDLAGQCGLLVAVPRGVAVLPALADADLGIGLAETLIRAGWDDDLPVLWPDQTEAAGDGWRAYPECLGAGTAIAGTRLADVARGIDSAWEDLARAGDWGLPAAECLVDARSIPNLAATPIEQILLWQLGKEPTGARSFGARLDLGQGRFTACRLSRAEQAQRLGAGGYYRAQPSALLVESALLGVIRTLVVEQPHLALEPVTRECADGLDPRYLERDDAPAPRAASRAPGVASWELGATQSRRVRIR